MTSLARYFLPLPLILLAALLSLIPGFTSRAMAQPACQGVYTWVGSVSPESGTHVDIFHCDNGVVVTTPIPTEIPTETPVATDTPTPTPTAVPPTFTPFITNTPLPTHTHPPTATTQPSPTPNSAAQVRIVPDQYASINAALVGIPAGSTIRVRTGTYGEQIGIGVPGITIEPYGDGPVWIDGGCVREVAVRITVDDVTIRGLGMRNTTARGVLIRGPSDSINPARATIEGNQIQDYNCTDTYVFIGPGQFTGTIVGDQSFAAIASWYGGAGHRIVGNTINRRVDLPGSQRGNGNGIWFKSNNDHPSGGGHIITDNFITGGFDGIGGETEDHVPGSFHRDTLIARNRVHDCADDGIQSEGGNINVWIDSNMITECGIGIGFAPNLVGPLFVTNNWIESSSEGVHAETLACMKVGNNGTGFAYLTNNVCNHTPGVYNPNDGDYMGDGIKQTNSGLQGFVMEGNIINASRYVIEFSGAPRTGSTFNDTCYYTSDAGSPARFMKYGNERYDSLAEMQAAYLSFYGREFSPNAVVGPCTIPPMPVLPPYTPMPTAQPLPTLTPTPTPIPPTLTPTPVPGQFVLDNFIGPYQQIIYPSGHVGELGATWTIHPRSAAGYAKIDQNNRAVAGNDLALTYASGLPSTTEYDVEVALVWLGGAGDSYTGPVGRINTANDSGYWVWSTGTQWKLASVLNGVVTVLGTSPQTLVTGTTYTVRLELRDSAKRVVVNGTTMITSADNSIPSAGRAGFSTYGNQAAIDSLVAINR